MSCGTLLRTRVRFSPPPPAGRSRRSGLARDLPQLLGGSGICDEGKPVEKKDRSDTPPPKEQVVLLRLLVLRHALFVGPGVLTRGLQPGQEQACVSNDTKPVLGWRPLRRSRLLHEVGSKPTSAARERCRPQLAAKEKLSSTSWKAASSPPGASSSSMV